MSVNHAFVPEMNRHHYSLYVHNCRLVFLLRRDFTQVDTFRPAEFHWKLEQVRGSAGACSCLLPGFKVAFRWRSVLPLTCSSSFTSFVSVFLYFTYILR